MTDLRSIVGPPSHEAPFAVRVEHACDAAPREALLDACFGEHRHERTCERLRGGRTPAKGLALSAVRGGELVGTLRLWHVGAGGVPALILGPLAVDPACRKLGIASALMERALAGARARGHRAVILLGDLSYYSRFGFSSKKTAELVLPGPFERERLLGLELQDGALDGAWGMIVPTGTAAPRGKPARPKPLLAVSNAA